MKHLTKAALLSAGAALVAPRAVIAIPRADASDPKAIAEELLKAFTEFKATNEEKLGAKVDDVLFSEKLTTINADLDALGKAMDEQKAELAAAKLGGVGSRGTMSPDAKAHADAFNAWFRKGVEPASMRELEVKAQLTTQSDPDGGYLVPEEMDKVITRVLAKVSAMRQLARVITVGTNDYSALVGQGGAAGGWVAEKDARPETATPKLAKIGIELGEVYAQPASTQAMLDDGMQDIAAWLADEVSITFGEMEGAAFISGDGKEKPRGILSYANVANAQYVWGKVGFVVSGAAADFIDTSTTDNPADCLMSLYYALRAGYRNGAAFLTSDKTIGVMRQFKDSYGQYIWAPPTADMPALILGKPIYTDDNMPDLGANAFPVAFGNFQRAYTIADRLGVRVLRDPYTSKPNVLFYTTKRVGGGITNFEAIKLLKCST